MIIAKTKPRDSRQMPGGVLFHEYQIRQLSSAERNQHAELYHERRLYGMATAYVMEQRTVHESDAGRIEKEWSILDWSADPERLASGSGGGDYYTATSLHEWHSKAVEQYNAYKTLVAEHENLYGQLHGLRDKYEDLYHAALKERRLFSKAAKNAVAQQIIEEIQQPLRAKYLKEQEALKQRIAEINKRLEEHNS